MARIGFVGCSQARSTISQMKWQDLETFTFGDGPDLANSLVELVLSGTKRATCWAESQGLLSAELGKLMVVLDGQGFPKAVLKTIELTKRRFDEVDEAFELVERIGETRPRTAFRSNFSKEEQTSASAPAPGPGLAAAQRADASLD